MCLYPKLVRNPKYKSNKKNKGIVPQPKDGRTLFVPIGCGKCIECRRQKARNWQVRLLEEIKRGDKGYFVTLTFNTENYTKLFKQVDDKRLTAYETDNELAKRAVRLFLERWRKHNGTSVRHWLVSELGHENTEHIHLHGLIWTNNPSDDIRKHWSYGFAWIGDKPKNYVNEKTVNYIIKYVVKADELHKEYNPVVLCSKGIGREYLNKFNVKNNRYKYEKTDETYRTRTGHKIALPIYYRNHIYNDDERENLWIYKLDQKRRYVLGQKIDISENEKYYESALIEAQKLNKRLGYGDDSIDWDSKEYENERRLLKQMERGVIDEDDFNRKREDFKRYRKFKENPAG